MSILLGLEPSTDLESDSVNIVSGGGDVHHPGLGDDLGLPGHLPDGLDCLTGNTEPGLLLRLHCLETHHDKDQQMFHHDCSSELTW